MKQAVVATALLGAILLPALPATAAGPATSGDGSGAYIQSVGALRAGDPVPKFKAKDIFGADLVFEDLMRAGKRPVLAFWSMYCQACVEKFNAMVALQTKYEAQGLKVISVNTDGEYQKGEGTIREFVQDYEKKNAIRINFPVLYDDRNWLPNVMHIEFLPTIVSVDPQGRVFGFYQGFNEAGPEEIFTGIEVLVQQMLALYPACASAAAAPPASLPGKK